LVALVILIALWAVRVRQARGRKSVAVHSSTRELEMNSVVIVGHVSSGREEKNVELPPAYVPAY
jgi:hypothetical protein